MKVGIDGRALQFSGAVRGTGRYLMDLLYGLSNCVGEAEFVIFHFESLPLPPELDPLWSKMERRAVAFPASEHERYPWYLMHPRLRTLPVLPRLHRRAYLRKQGSAFSDAMRASGVDIVHVPAVFDPRLGPISRNQLSPNAKAGPKLVSTFLDAIPLVFRDRYYDTWNTEQKELYELQRAALASSDWVVAISDSSRNDAIRLFGVAKDRVSTVYLAAFGDVHLTASNHSICAKYRLKAPYFMFSSVADWHKALDRVIPAFAAFKERLGTPFQLVVVGSQQPSEMTMIRNLCFDHGLNGRDVVVVGHVPEEEYRALMQGAKALVCTSRYEGFGLPAAQAMSLGVPVIASNVSSLPEVVGNAGILIDPEDETAISEAMWRIAHDDSLAAELANLGPAEASQFTRERQAQSMMEIYRSLLPR